MDKPQRSPPTHNPAFALVLKPAFSLLEISLDLLKPCINHRIEQA
jgi:hypothetical protein